MSGLPAAARQDRRWNVTLRAALEVYSFVQVQLAKVIHFEGSPEEKKARSLLSALGIDYDKLSKEQLVTLIEILKLSKYLKSPISQRGKARPQLPYGKGKRKHK